MTLWCTYDVATLFGLTIHGVATFKLAVASSGEEFNNFIVRILIAIGVLAVYLCLLNSSASFKQEQQHTKVITILNGGEAERLRI